MEMSVSADGGFHNPGCKLFDRLRRFRSRALQRWVRLLANSFHRFVTLIRTGAKVNFRYWLPARESTLPVRHERGEGQGARQPSPPSCLRACLKNSGAGLRPAMDGRLARENTGASRPKGRRDACPTTFSKRPLRRRGSKLSSAPTKNLSRAPEERIWRIGLD